MKKELIEIDIDDYSPESESVKYLGKKGKGKIKRLFKDPSSGNWLMAELKDGYFIALSNGNGCTSHVFGSIEHTKSIYNIPEEL